MRKGGNTMAGVSVSTTAGRGTSPYTATSDGTKHATWGEWPHVGTCYRIRARGGVSAFSREGFAWTDSYANALPRPAAYIMFHEGPLNGKTVKGGQS